MKRWKERKMSGRERGGHRWVHTKIEIRRERQNQRDRWNTIGRNRKEIEKKQEKQRIGQRQGERDRESLIRVLQEA